MIAAEAVEGMDMSPPRETTTDASKLTFPVQLVMVIVGAFVSMYAATWELRSDVRLIMERLENQTKWSERDMKELTERIQRVEKDTRDHIAEYKLEGYDYKTLEARILALERRR